jgi:hypothetical protein
MSPERKIEISEAALQMMKGLAPRDEAEGLLVAQMVATHSAALDCLRRAILEGQSFEGRELNLKHGEKLMALYVRQQEALDKHRGHGQQKITVEHVNVHAGGQAIVGNVEAGTTMAEALRSSGTQGALTRDPGELAPQMNVESLDELEREIDGDAPVGEPPLALTYDPGQLAPLMNNARVEELEPAKRQP